MSKIFKSLVVFSALSLGASAAMAATVTDTIGDKDGLGLGLTDGDGFDYSLVGPGDGDGTDEWRYGSYTYSHTYSLAGLGALSSASIEIGHGGDGLSEPGKLLLNGLEIGTLTDGDDVGPDYNYYFVDSFDLGSYLAELDGTDSFTVSLALAGDGWALDYSELTISDGATAPIPLPAGAWLLLGGLGGLAALRRRKKA